MDLSKAFDILDHSILLSRLAYYGIGRDIGNNLLKSYLTDKYQYVKYKCTDHQPDRHSSRI